MSSRRVSATQAHQSQPPTPALAQPIAPVKARQSCRSVSLRRRRMLTRGGEIRRVRVGASSVGLLLVSVVGAACVDGGWLHQSETVVEVRHGQVCITNGALTECVPIASVKVVAPLELKPGACVDVRRFGGSARFDSAKVVDCPDS